MKKITAILLVLAMCLVLMTTGAFAKVKEDPSNGKAAKSSEVVATEENAEENAEENTEEKTEGATDTEKQLNRGQQKKADREAALSDAENTEGTAIQAKNRGQAKKLEERIKVRGMNMKFDIPPVIKEGRTLIPVRAIMNGLKAQVAWDQETKIVTITRDDKVITLNLLTGEAKVNGEVIELDVPPEIISNRTFVPLRFVAQSLGEKVDYDEETGEIDIGDEEVDEENDAEVDEDEEVDEENDADENADENVDDETDVEVDDDTEVDEEDEVVEEN